MSTWIIFGTERDGGRRSKMCVMDGHHVDNVKSYLRDCHIAYNGVYSSFDAMEVRDDGVIVPNEKVLTVSVDDVTKRFIETYEGKHSALGTIDTGMEAGADNTIVVKEAPKPVGPKPPKDPKNPAAVGRQNFRAMKSSEIEKEMSVEKERPFIDRIHKKNLAIFGSGASILTVFYFIVFFSASWSTALPWSCLISLLMAWAVVWKTSIRPTK